MNNGLSFGFGVFFLAVLLLIPVPGFAVFEIHPRLSLSEEYNDNIFLDERDEKDDFITVISPGVLLNYRARELRVDLDYSLVFRKYADNTDEDETDFKDIQRGLAKIELFPDRNFTLNLLGEISRVVVDESRPASEDNSLENRTTLYRYIVNPQYVFRKIPTYEVIFDYLLDGRDYVDDNGDDSLSNQAGVEIVKSFSRRLSTSLGYRFEDFNDQSNDNDDVGESFQRQDVFASVVFELSPVWSVSGRGGQAWIDFDEKDKTDSLLWGLGLNYRPSSLFAASLNYDENFESTVEDGLVKSKRGSLLLSYLGKIPVSFELFNDRSTYEEEDDREEETTGAVLTATFPLATRFNLLASVNYSYSEYDEELPGEGTEEVDAYGGRVSLEYVTRYVTFVLSHSYRERDSNFAGEDYTNNITFLSAVMEL